MLLSSLSTVFSIFILMAFGMLALRFKWLDMPAVEKLPALILNLSMPANILVSFNTYFVGRLSELSFFTVALPFVILLSLFALAFFVAKLIKLPPERMGVYCAMCAISNAGFVGIPLLSALYGGEAVVYASFYMFAAVIVNWTLGYILIRRDADRLSGQASHIKAGDIAKRLLCPPVITLAAALILCAAGVTLPSAVMAPIGFLGDMTTPLSMIYVGALIYNSGKEVFRMEKGIPSLLVIRIAAAGAIAFLLSRAVGLPDLTGTVYTVQSILPAMAGAGIIAGMYGADERFAAKGILYTTLPMLVVIPLLTVLLPV